MQVRAQVFDGLNLWLSSAVRKRACGFHIVNNVPSAIQDGITKHIFQHAPGESEKGRVT